MALFVVVSMALTIGGLILLRHFRRLRDDVSDLRQTIDAQSTQIQGLTRRIYELEGRAAVPLKTPVIPPPLPPAEAPAPAPEPVAASAPTQQTSGDDWETLVGANWLNRVGALVLVIGIALFLGYSLTHLGPAGKVAIGFALGLSMLAAGLAIERHERYRNFAFSLIGGGWAATYFTGYAMHGIEAARVITSS